MKKLMIFLNDSKQGYKGNVYFCLISDDEKGAKEGWGMWEGRNVEFFNWGTRQAIPYRARDLEKGQGEGWRGTFSFTLSHTGKEERKLLLNFGLDSGGGMDGAAHSNEEQGFVLMLAEKNKDFEFPFTWLSLEYC